MALISTMMGGLAGFFAFLIGYFQFDYSVAEAFGLYLVIGMTTTTVLATLSLRGPAQAYQG